MFKRRTSRRYQRERDCRHMLHLNVNSPRIILFKSVNLLTSAAKVLLVAGLLWLTGWGVNKGANSLFIQNEEYSLRDIELTTNGFFSRQRVIEETRIKKGATLFSIDPRFMENTLEQLPEVVEARVERVLPDRLRVSMKERVPVARLHAPFANCYSDGEGESLLVGEGGYLFPSEGALKIAAQQCPIIMVEKGSKFVFKSGERMRHEEALRAHSLVLEHSHFCKGKSWKLKKVKVIDFYTLVAEYDDGVLATFGMYDHRRQIQDLEDIRLHASLAGKRLQWLDLRPKRNIPGQYKISQL